jgi:2-polyprenyl-6-hydroxyphenyl methylase/3-demethylubiquinone-9 3-methyltransferase
MTEKTTGDAVGHFSANASQFHSYYRDNPEFHERLDIWRDLLDRHSVRGGFSVDMGCGSGVFSLYLAEKGGRVVGVDGAADMVKLCETQRVALGLENVRFIEARLPAVDETPLVHADLVISSSVVEYVEDLDAVLALFSRLLKPHATLILSMPNAFSISRVYERVKFALTGNPEIYKYIRHFTSPRALQARLRRLGLELEEVRYYTHRTRLARLTRTLRLPPPLTEDLFVGVFRKS